MGTSLEERETTIRWDDAEKVAHIWTCSPITIRKLDKLVEELPDVYKCTTRNNDGVWYEVAAKFISFRKPVVMTDEQREAARERLVKYRAAQQVEGGDS